jgi:hypothetical protein
MLACPMPKDNKMDRYNIITGLAFELVAQGVWDTEDLERFVHSMMRRGWDQGFTYSQGGGVTNRSRITLHSGQV